MAEKSDIAFTFDASQFTEAMKQMTSSMKGFQENTKNMTSKISAGAFKAIAGAKILFGALKAGAKAIFGAVRDNIPELGATFGIAKNIILKNLLYPLRMALLPVLQNLLNWVGKNRKLFLELGGVIVNAFKMVKSIFMSVYNMVSPIIDVIKDVMKSIFGDTAKSITETINLIMVKIMVFTMMLSNILKPVFEGIASVIRGVIEAVKGLAEGFASLFDKSNAISLFSTLKETLQGIGDLLVNLKPLFVVIGGIIAGAFNVAVDAAKILLHTLNLILGVINGIITKKGAGSAWESFKGNIESDVMSGGTAGMINKIKPEKKDDFIITKSGQVIQPNKNDVIMGTKNGAGIGGANFTIYVGGVHVTVTEGNAVNAGENFVRGLERQIKNVLLNQLTLEGNP